MFPRALVGLVQPKTTDPFDPAARFRRWLAIFAALAAFGYLGYAVWRGWSQTAAVLASFDWPLYVVVLALTLVNYGLRFWKWAWLLGRVGVQIPLRTNLWIFGAGLAMVITPGKAGELLKPYLVRVATGAALETTVPVLVAERGTDGITVVILAALGVSTFYADGTTAVYGTLAAMGFGLALLSSQTLGLGAIGLVRRFSPGIADRVETTWRTLRICTAPWPLFVTLTVSFGAWVAECIGMWLVFHGLGVKATLAASTFLYAFATLFGAPSPGGMGMADAALVEGAMAVVPGIDGPQAVAAALLIRVATLWFGVGIGGLALLGMEGALASARQK